MLEINQSVKMIVSSSYSDDPIKINCRDYGFHGVIVKEPYKIREIHETVRSVLDEGPLKNGH